MRKILDAVKHRGIKGLSETEKDLIRTQLTTSEIQRIIQLASDGFQEGHQIHSREMRARNRASTDKQRKEKMRAARDEARRSFLAPNSNPIPKGRLIRTPRDAELAAVASMKYLGFSDAQETPVGADEGIDVNSTKAVAQVKAYMVPVGRPDVQNLAGVAAAEKKRGFFFALSGYTPQAIQWADKANVALFSFDLQGRPEAVNKAAHKLLP